MDDERGKAYPIEEALRAQKALRSAAGLADEQFPIEAFVGMISDEIESLRKRGKSDADIAAIIRHNSSIEISAAEIAETMLLLRSASTTESRCR